MEPINNYIIYISTQETDWLNVTAASFSAFAALVTAAIAFWALRFSAKQMEMHDKNYRLMTKPKLDDTKVIDIHKQKLIYQLANSGIGPAIVKHTEFYFEGKIIEEEDPITHIIKELVPGIDTHHFGHQTIANDSYIPTNKTLNLLTINCEEYCKVEELATDLARKVRMVIHYESIYEESFTFDTSL